MKIRFPKWNGMCGLFCVEFYGFKKDWRSLTIQLIIPKYKKWLWGYETVWYDGPHYSFGLGPLFLITWE